MEKQLGKNKAPVSFCLVTRMTNMAPLCSQCSSHQIHRAEHLPWPNPQGRRPAFRIMCTNRKHEERHTHCPLIHKQPEVQMQQSSQKVYQPFQQGTPNPRQGLPCQGSSDRLQPDTWQVGCRPELCPNQHLKKSHQP